MFSFTNTGLADDNIQAFNCEDNEFFPQQVNLIPEENDNNSGDSAATKESTTGSNIRKRYLPSTKKPDAPPTFPEKLMEMMKYVVETQQAQPKFSCVGWMPDGKSIIIRDPDQFTNEVVPKFFKPTKFSSFTRKLYRWGFRQLNRGTASKAPIIFGSEHFQRQSPEMIAKMRSVTAAAMRKEELRAQQMQQNQQDMSLPVFFGNDTTGSSLVSGTKRQWNSVGHGEDVANVEENFRKRMMMQQQIDLNESNNINNQNGNYGNKMNDFFFPFINNNTAACASLPLMDALRPNPLTFGNNNGNMLKQGSNFLFQNNNVQQNNLSCSGGFGGNSNSCEFAGLPSNIYNTCMMMSSNKGNPLLNLNNSGVSNSGLSQQPIGLSSATVPAATSAKYPSLCNEIPNADLTRNLLHEAVTSLDFENF